MNHAELVAHPFVTAVASDYPEELGRADLTIHPDDEMLGFLIEVAKGDLDRALAYYFMSAASTFDFIRALAHAHFGGLDHVRSMLDFASGYGRVSRLLAMALPPGSLTVSDILEPAMEFQGRQFGVKTLLSATEPDDFSGNRAYELIFSASLFTHLPRRTFLGWMGRLLSMLDDGGALAFSVHDMALKPKEIPGGEDGFAFAAYSESSVLDSAEYGSTWVSEEFMKATVAAIAPSWDVHRFPEALSNHQDVYVVSRQRRVESFDAGPLGWLQSVHFEGEMLVVRGWAVVREGSPLARVDIRFEDERVTVKPPLLPHEGVAQLLGQERFRESGFEVRLRRPRRPRFSNPLVLTATTESGKKNILFAGSLESAFRQTADGAVEVLMAERAALGLRVDELGKEKAEVERRNEELRAQVEAMRASRFWKARDRWFAMKRSLRMTEEK